MVLDTEMYSNTGGQKSKSTPLGAVTKFAAGGKQRPKKDLGQMAMGYGDVYVASTNLEANYGQVVKAMAEAERYPGVSLLVNYATCVMQGIEGGMCHSINDARIATETGYWPLYRYDPRIVEDAAGKHRFQLDSKRMKGDLERFLHHENRFSILERKDPESSERLHRDLEIMIKERQARLVHLSQTEVAHPTRGLHEIEELERIEIARRGSTQVGPGGEDKPGKPSAFS